MSPLNKKYDTTLYRLISTYRDLSLAISQELKPVVEDYGITIFQFRILICLCDNGMNLTELAEKTHSYKGYTSSAVDGLVSSRMVSRHYPPEDRRSIHLQITDKGKEVLDQILGIGTPFYQRLSAAFHFPEEEMEHFIEVHQNVIANLVNGGKESL
ncbi:MarR family transcriptional regulator [Alicyclobacillus fastidiosus]|uniref:MarR family transcriptional regulator n=1 Tax=Alicyclobacillus fastidiosus TaxID=392011 RepID=A0ABY6ZG27_9BACL|nr:MarR family transcriptional regulator [Alicyclobacillus fastidiosus]WAH41791.1 MarR family transcriptional regulator [Alicyclobacillus fastidiosus]GMA63486.1 hypothetical protein GCM10025859_39260 [Alicyclobacillus fastidiosus]